MNITQITVSYQETCSLPEYSNVRPSVTLTADVQPGEDVASIWAGLLAEARAVVQNEIDDALERHGKKTKYYDGPRFQLLQSPDREHRDILLMSNDSNDWPRGWTHLLFPSDSRGLREAYARRTAHEIAARRGGVVIDCSDGDLSRVPHPFDEEDAREQEHTSEVYRQAMGWAADEEG